jgi:hypothetical protein
MTQQIPDLYITTRVRMLMARDAVNVEAVARSIGESPATLYRRMARGGWTAVEVARLADYFQVDPATMYADPGAVPHPFRARRLSAA